MLGFGGRTRRLQKELRTVGDDAKTKLNGFMVETVNDDLACWHVKLINFEGEVARDLKTTQYDHVLLEIKFPSEYPNLPPFVRVVYPKFKFRTGHVTVGGSICVEMLTNSGTKTGWNSSISMEAVILTVRQLMIDGKARIVSNATYTEDEAKSAFQRVAQHHGWSRRPLPAPVRYCLLGLGLLVIILCLFWFFWS